MGCAGPGPKMFPPAPARVEQLPDSAIRRWYDTNLDGRADYCEHYSAEGSITALGYDRNGDMQIDEHVVLEEIPADKVRHLVLILDSVPFLMVEELRALGRLRMFYTPARVISPFPVMTDLCLSEFFGVSPCPGIESAYYDGRRVTDRYSVYLNAGNVNWKENVDYRMDHVAHAFAYSEPSPWLGHELRAIRELFFGGNKRLTSPSHPKLLPR